MNNNTPLVSIIVVTYNSSLYVEETLDSAFNQDYKNIELIVTDDYSDDSTMEIVSDWVAKFSARFVRCEIIPAEENRGIPSNINKALKNIKGEWVKVIAGDDILSDSCITDNMKFANENNASLIYSDLAWFLDKGERIDHDRSEDKYRSAFSSLNSQGQIKFYARYPVFLNSSSWFYSLKKINFIYDEEFMLLEDQPFIFNYLQTGEHIVYMNKTTVRYRRHDKSVVITNNTKFLKEFNKCYKKYRVKYLSVTSFIDLFYICRFYAFIAERWTSKYLLLKIMFFPVKKSMNVFSTVLRPECGLKKYRIQ